MRLLQERRSFAAVTSVSAQARSGLAPKASHGSRPARVFVGASVAVVVADQLAKMAVLARIGPDEQIGLVGGVRFIRSFNRGISFSFGSEYGGGWVVVPVMLIVVGLAAFVAHELRRPLADPKRPSPVQAIGYGLIAGGAIGNVADRLFRKPGWGRGAVVDFVDVRFWPVFNLADAALTCGVLLLLALSLRDRGPNGDTARGGETS